MASFSLRQAAKDGGFNGGFSLCRHIYGYRQGHLPKNPAGAGTRMSLRQWAGLGQGNSFNLNVIAVGVESFTSADFDEMDTAVGRMREVYGAIGVGVKWVLPFKIDTADAQGHDVLTSEDEIDDLLSGWAVENGGIDLYFPAGWSFSGDEAGLLGLSVIDGPCPFSKDVKGNKGSCVGLTGQTSARSASHEVGHYLGLEHRQDENYDLMAQTQFAKDPKWQQVGFDPDQASAVKLHCMVLKWWIA